MALDHLIDIDLSAEIAGYPKQPGARTLAERSAEQYVTLHYSGVAYQDRSRAAELAHIRAEAKEHLRRDWGDGKAIYGDGYMYDLVVLSDGGIVRTRGRRQQLWHCGNGDGNERSWSVHVLLGRDQDLTVPQRASLFRLFDALRAETGLSRAAVVGHNEWPRGDGRPLPSPVYRMLFRQSECPGRLIHAHLAAYRAMRDTAPTRYVTTRDIPVREAPRTDAPIAWGGSCIIPAGRELELAPAVAGWLHWPAGGFLPTTAATALANDDLTFIAAPRISRDQFVWVLARALSPAAAEAGAMYDAIANEEVDPGLGLAFFKHESSFGKAGLCLTEDLRNIGNVRTPMDAGRGVQLTIPGRGLFFKYHSWTLGARDWAVRMRDKYTRQLGLPTVRLALPTYAPSSDGNKPAAYAADVLASVRQWQQEDRRV